MLAFALLLLLAPQAPQQKFDPHDLSGHWNRTSRFQTFSNVPTGQGNAAGTVEAPFTPEGKAKFETNKPGYGPRAVPPALGNDPMGTCDPLGIPRLLNTEVSENMKLQERYRRIDADTLELTMTITDPEMYTRPWVSDTKLFRLDRAKSSRWDEQIYCVPTEEYKFNQRVRDEAGGKGVGK